MCTKKIEKWVDIDSLPHNKSLVDWKKSVGHSVSFRYGNKSGEIKITQWIDSRHLEVEYNGNKTIISPARITHGNIGGVINRRNYDWKYNIGDNVFGKGDFVGIVVDRYYKRTAMSTKSRFYKIQCSICHGIFDRFENEIEMNSCSVCSRRVLNPGINDIQTTDPEIAEQLLNPEDGKKYTIGQRVFLDWRCPKCGEIVKGLTPNQVRNAIGHRVPCKKCSDAYSYPNKFFFNLFRKVGVKFEAEKSFDWKGLGLRRYDFYFPDKNAILEVHGGQHYDKRYPQIPINDKEKEEIAIHNGIAKYIVIKCIKSEPKYIMNQIKKSSLMDFIDISNIDMYEIDYLASKKMINKVLEVGKECNYFGPDIAEATGIDRTTISRYINVSIKNGILDEEYVRKCQLENKIKDHYQLDGKPLMCLDTGEVFGNYSAIRDYLADEFPAFSNGSFVQGLKRIGGTSYGRHWKHITRKEFNEIKRQSPDKAFGDFFISEIDK